MKELKINVLTSEKIINEIEPMLKQGVDIIDAVMTYANRHNLEVELVGSVVKGSPLLVSKFRDAAEKLNLVEKRDDLCLF